MRIIYLETTVDDFLWMRQYYEVIFPQGHVNVQRQFRAIEKTLLANPFIGHEMHRSDVREFSIPKTPFSYIYRAFPDRIEVLRVWDERQDRAKLDE